MKLIMNYDLMEKINNANGNINYQKMALTELKFQAFLYSLLTAMNIFTIKEINWLTNLLIVTPWFIAKLAIYSFVENMFKNANKHIAELTLIKLAILLKEFNISTDLELLKDSKLLTTEYKVNFNEHSIPILKQNKYVLIPNYNWQGQIRETSFLQEHTIGSKEYILSIGSPQKTLKLVPSFG